MGSTLDTQLAQDYNNATNRAYTRTSQLLPLALRSHQGSVVNAAAMDPNSAIWAINAIANSAKLMIAMDVKHQIEAAKPKGPVPPLQGPLNYADPASFLVPKTKNVRFTPSPATSSAELSDLRSISNYYQQKHMVLEELSIAVKKWAAWNNNIKEFYDTGLLKARGSSMADVKYSAGENHDEYESTKAANLEEYFHFIHSRTLYGETGTRAQFLKAANETKNRNAEQGKAAVEHMLEVAKKNTEVAFGTISQIAALAQKCTSAIESANAAMLQIGAAISANTQTVGIMDYKLGGR